MATASESYERDYYAWAMKNAQLIRQGKLSEIDLNNIAEELEDVGKSERRALKSHIKNVILHLLKWRYQPNFRGASWRQSVRNGRIAIHEIVTESPSLNRDIAHIIESEYSSAQADAIDETGLSASVFPPTCPFSESQVSGDYWPD